MNLCNHMQCFGQYRTKMQLFLIRDVNNSPLTAFKELFIHFPLNIE